MCPINPVPNQPIQTRKRILVLDDDQDTCEMMTLLIQSFGYRAKALTTIADCEEGIRTEEFDLLIFDAIGLELCKRLRADGSDTPILFLSGYTLSSDIEAYIEAGAQAYLAKPFDADELKRTISRLIN